MSRYEELLQEYLKEKKSKKFNCFQTSDNEASYNNGSFESDNHDDDDADCFCD